MYALTKLGAQVRVVGPPTMIPSHVERLGVSVFYSLDEALRDAQVIMMLRLQLERQGRALFPTIREYARLYGLTAERVKLAEAGAIVMHPGPINRGVEIDSAVVDGKQSVILPQVTFGIAVRMAVMSIVAGNEA
jgi:aspartate carbamoyltransferase catalytic subunit